MKGSKYLILVALIVDDPRALDRLIKNVRRYKFNKELSGAMEIKANSSSDELRKYVLTSLNKIEGATAYYIILKKSDVYSKFLKENKNKQYNFVAGKLADIINLKTKKKVKLDIKIDKSKGKQFLRDDFNAYFSKRLKVVNECIDDLKISHSYSHAWSGLQFVDMIAWACFQKFERGNSEFIDMLKIDQHSSHVWKNEEESDST